MSADSGLSMFGMMEIGTPVTGYQAYQQLCGNVPGTGSLTDGTDTISQLTSGYQQVSDLATSLKNQLATAWEGQAGDAAVAASTPLETAFQAMHDGLQQHTRGMGDQVSQFTGSAGQIRTAATLPSTGQPLGPTPPSNNFLNEITPWHTQLDTQINEYNTADQACQQVLSDYQTKTTANTGQLPADYTAITTDSTPNIQVSAPPPSGGSSAPGYTPHPGSSGTGSRSGSALAATAHGAGTSAGAPNPSGPGTPGSGPGTGGGSQSTTGQNYINPTPVIGAGNPPGGGTTNPGAGNGLTPGDGGGGGVFAPVGGFGPAGGGDTYAPGRGYNGAGGYNTSNTGGGIGRGGSGAASGIGEPETPAGAGAAAAAAERMGTARTGTPAGMAGGAGRRSEDKEHKTAAFLVNEDNGNLIVGELGSTIPPVIGG